MVGTVIIMNNNNMIALTLQTGLFSYEHLCNKMFYIGFDIHKHMRKLRIVATAQLHQLDKQKRNNVKTSSKRNFFYLAVGLV